MRRKTAKPDERKSRLRIEPVCDDDQSRGDPMHKATDTANPDVSGGISELRSSDWVEVVGEILRKKCTTTDRVLLCLTGKSGSGKSTIAREFRKKGLPGFKPSEIAVIDDGVMTAPLFGFINRRVRIASKRQDDLAPFEPYLRRKRLVVYIAIKPEERITRCDVLVRLRCNDEERHRRLVASRSNGAVRYENSLRKPDDILVRADVSFDLATG